MQREFEREKEEIIRKYTQEKQEIVQRYGGCTSNNDLWYL